MQNTRAELLYDTAAEVGRGMQNRTKDAAKNARVAVAVADFEYIAELLVRVADRARAQGGGLDADGFRFWTPLPHLLAHRDELGRLRQETAELRARVQMTSLRF